MVSELEILVPGFAGFRHHICCFLYILNLVVQSMMKQFDLRKTASELPNSEEMEALLEDIEDDEEEAENKLAEDEEPFDNIDGFVDVVDNMSDDEREEIMEALRPARLVLAKVSCRII